MNQESFDGNGAQLQAAFVSGGNLFYKMGDAEPDQLHSPYVQEMIDRTEKSRKLHAWKENTSFSIGAGGRSKQFGSDEVRITATSVQIDKEQTLLYFLKDATIGGLFSYDFGSKVEKRLLHRQNLDLCDLNLNRDSGKIACSSRNKSGIANIAILSREGDQFREITGGDTLDSSPSWLPGEDKRLVYQSIGLARDDNGYIAAQGNATIQMLDMQSGSVEPVMEDARYDFLQPRICPQGNLHFIRRPYERPGYGIGSFITDTLFFPFRLLRALFHYLNFFSMMYTRKPLTSASGPALKADLKEIILKGKRINTEKALRRETKINGVPSLVPRSWQLIRRTQQGAEQVLATNVASYDIASDGRVYYSNGKGVFLLSEDGKAKLVLQSDLVGDLALAPT